MEKQLKEKWKNFLNGHFQKELPQKAGRYPVRTSDGYDGGFITIYIHPDTKKAKATTPWGGEYWSEPLPSLPGVKD